MAQCHGDHHGCLLQPDRDVHPRFRSERPLRCFVRSPNLFAGVKDHPEIRFEPDCFQSHGGHELCHSERRSQRGMCLSPTLKCGIGQFLTPANSIYSMRAGSTEPVMYSRAMSMRLWTLNSAQQARSLSRHPMTEQSGSSPRITDSRWMSITPSACREL